MSLRNITHSWQVQDLEHGPLVKLAQRDLDIGTVSILADELFKLTRESGRPRLSLDFKEVSVLPTLVVGKLLALERRLREVGGQLLLYNLNPAVKGFLQAEGWPGDVTAESAPAGEPLEPENCFVVFVREGPGAAEHPEMVERPVATCFSYEEAARLREELRPSGKNCIIRFIGQAGGGD
jgi:anti-anti-sigma regulatory factor